MEILWKAFITYSMFSWVMALKVFFLYLIQKKMFKKIAQILTHSKTKMLNLICLLENIFISTNESIKYECKWNSKIFLKI